MPTNPPIYVVGNTHMFLLTALKDGVIWDLTLATVTLDFVRPPDANGNRSSFTVNATVISGPAGTAQFTTLPNPTPTLNVSGMWERWWHVVVGGIDMRYGPLRFDVVDEATS